MDISKIKTVKLGEPFINEGHNTYVAQIFGHYSFVVTQTLHYNYINCYIKDVWILNSGKPSISSIFWVLLKSPVLKSIEEAEAVCNDFLKEFVENASKIKEIRFDKRIDNSFFFEIAKGVGFEAEKGRKGGFDVVLRNDNYLQGNIILFRSIEGFNDVKKRCLMFLEEFVKNSLEGDIE